MRLDKFLKVARVFKRRTIAKEVADHDKILVNGHGAKPSTMLKIGDIVVIRYGSKEFTIKVLNFANQASKEFALSMYELIEDKTIDTLNKHE